MAEFSWLGVRVMLVLAESLGVVKHRLQQRNARRELFMKYESELTVAKM